eukprot:gnl/TRDRNA2_/TRDRNA2_164257_c0_seq2.p1 gnl/TRDRNA2_/TRDRNA2_164257_c0~~gnl/TRDRNA2_/TRDRNA2_164257_c0_seq2.p1  ORF type:complete len:416 (-),score=26.03 gnl/TRDRNA2_/TRDRNA2_164257_c0_seq2:42-1289(-)
MVVSEAGSEKSFGELSDDQAYFLKHVAAFAMTFGQGVMFAFYFALIAFYVERFKSPAFSLAMIVCVSLPGLLALVLQEYLDAYFDETYSTRTTYFFRVVLMQAALAIVSFIWLACPQSAWFVLMIGSLVGFLSACVNSSANQLVAAMDPTATPQTQLGHLVGAFVPAAVFFILDFHPSSSTATFRWALLCVPIICMCCGAYLGYLHFRHDIFDKSYCRLAYRSSLAPASIEQGMDRQDTETVPLLPTEDGKIPQWVWYWIAITFYVMNVLTIVRSMGAFFGKPEFTQMLFLSHLVMGTFGGLCALPIHRVPSFLHGPWHISLASWTFVITCTFVSMCLWLYGVIPVHRALFVVVWGTSHFLLSFVTAFVALTIGMYVEVKDRGIVARRNTICLFGGTATGVAIGIAMLLPLMDLL